MSGSGVVRSNFVALMVGIVLAVANPLASEPRST
jgi:hypothetical protein